MNLPSGTCLRAAATLPIGTLQKISAKIARVPRYGTAVRQRKTERGGRRFRALYPARRSSAAACPEPI
jgi:hypothetical protein